MSFVAKFSKLWRRNSIMMLAKQAPSIKLTKGLVKKIAKFFMFKIHIYHLTRLPLSIVHHINMGHIGCCMHTYILYKTQKFWKVLLNLLIHNTILNLIIRWLFAKMRKFLKMWKKCGGHNLNVVESNILKWTYHHLPFIANFLKNLNLTNFILCWVVDGDAFLFTPI